MTISNKVRAFVCTNFYVPDPDVLREQESLLEAGIVDSTGVVEIIGFLEGEFGIRVEDAEIVSENLDSIERITAFVTRKLAARTRTATLEIEEPAA